MCRLVCAFVVRNLQRQVFLCRGPYDTHKKLLSFSCIQSFLFNFLKDFVQTKKLLTGRNLPFHISNCCVEIMFPFLGAQWLSCRVLDSRPRGRGFETHRRNCVVSRHNGKLADWDVKNKSNKCFLFLMDRLENFSYELLPYIVKSVLNGHS